MYHQSSEVASVRKSCISSGYMQQAGKTICTLQQVRLRALSRPFIPSTIPLPRQSLPCYSLASLCLILVVLSRKDYKNQQVWGNPFFSLLYMGSGDFKIGIETVNFILRYQSRIPTVIWKDGVEARVSFIQSQVVNLAFCSGPKHFCTKAIPAEILNRFCTELHIFPSPSGTHGLINAGNVATRQITVFRNKKSWWFGS